MSEGAPTGRDFGRLEAQVDALDSKFGQLAGDVKTEMQSMREQMQSMRDQIERLTHLAERGKGAYWATMLIAAGIGALLTGAWRVIGPLLGGAPK